MNFPIIRALAPTQRDFPFFQADVIQNSFLTVFGSQRKSDPRLYNVAGIPNVAKHEKYEERNPIWYALAAIS